MASCYVSAKDYAEHFQIPTCPECGYTSDDPREFDYWFCPSWPDKCDGCELDEHREECPMCFHKWERVQ